MPKAKKTKKFKRNKNLRTTVNQVPKKPYDPRKEFHSKYVTWVIDKSLLEGTLVEKLPEVVINNGFRVITFNGNPNNYDLSNLPNGWMDEGSGPIIAYGSHKFILNVHHQPWFPGSYPQAGHEVSNLFPSVYMVKYPSEHLFNRDYILTPIAEIVRNHEFYFKIFNSNQIFVKHNDTFKSFGAKVLKIDEISKYLEPFVEQILMNDSSTVLISNAKPIISEHRFVVLNGKVIGHSTYRYNGILDIRIDVPPESIRFVEKMANIWSPSPCFTMDIAMTAEGPKILELNSFSCAGLYACDLDNIVIEISKQAREDFLDSCFPN